MMRPGKKQKTVQANSAAVARYQRARAAVAAQQFNFRGSTLGPMPGRGPEKKFIDTTPTFNIVASSSAFVATPVLLNGVGTGATATDRVGRKILMKSLYVRYALNRSATTTLGANVRIVVVYDRQPNAAPPGITDVFLADAFLSPNNLSNRDRFVILCDEVTESIDAAGPSTQAGTIYKKINLETTFNAVAASDITTITTGSVYMFVAQSGQAATANLALNARARIRFTDQ